MSTRVLLIIVIVVIALAITSAVIGSHNHSSATVKPDDASLQPSWMHGSMAWLSAHSPQAPIALSAITPGGIIDPTTRKVTLKQHLETVTLTIGKSAAASAPVRITLSLANQPTPVPGGTPSLLKITYAITDPPATVEAVQTVSLPNVPVPTPASGAPPPWQVVLVAYPGHEAKLTLQSLSKGSLEVGVN